MGYGVTTMHPHYMRYEVIKGSSASHAVTFKVILGESVRTTGTLQGCGVRGVSDMKGMGDMKGRTRAIRGNGCYREQTIINKEKATQKDR